MGGKESRVETTGEGRERKEGEGKKAKRGEVFQSPCLFWSRQPLPQSYNTIYLSPISGSVIST